MQRSSRRPRRRRSDSSSTARATERATANLTAVPDGGRRLSEGLVVEASVVARLFRIRVLAIDAGLVISPARVTSRSPVVAPRARSRAIGAGLAAAERSIGEGAASLAASRSIGRSARRPRTTAGLGGLGLDEHTDAKPRDPGLLRA
jgi:hypothetical protein